jgi:hypothetical protein
VADVDQLRAHGADRLVRDEPVLPGIVAEDEILRLAARHGPEGHALRGAVTLDVDLEVFGVGVEVLDGDPRRPFLHRLAVRSCAPAAGAADEQGEGHSEGGSEHPHPHCAHDTSPEVGPRGVARARSPDVTSPPEVIPGAR